MPSSTRQALMARERHLQALIGEAIRYGAEQGRFASDNIALKAHTIMVLAHAWAVRHWAFAGELESIEEYIAFLQPLVLAMLETKSGSKKSNKGQGRSAVIEGKISERWEEATSK